MEGNDILSEYFKIFIFKRDHKDSKNISKFIRLISDSIYTRFMIKTGFYKLKVDDTYILLIVQSNDDQLTYLYPDGFINVCVGAQINAAEKAFRKHYYLIECL